MRILRNIAIFLLVAWIAFCGTMYVQMLRPPEQFAAFMGKLPMIAMMGAPFETLWNRARRGTVDVGGEAPDFRLQTLDRKGEVSLASFRGSRPVVLIFGSYT